jgi:hypothetical protein
VFKSGYSRRSYFSKRTSTQGFNEAPKLDSCFGSGTVPVIAVPLAFRRHRLARGGSDKRSSRSKPDMDTDREKSTAEKKFFQEQKPAHR